MKTLQKYNVLQLDELGYCSISAKKAQLLFDVIAKRCESGASIFISSNFAFSKWPQFLGDSVMTNALVGKLTGASVVLNMNGTDYRVYLKSKQSAL